MKAVVKSIPKRLWFVATIIVVGVVAAFVALFMVSNSDIENEAWGWWK